MATLFRTDGTVMPVHLREEALDQLADLQRLVGGAIEVVRLDAGDDCHDYRPDHNGECTVCDEGPEGHGTVLGSWSVLVVDEEGKLRGKPANRLATVLAAEVLHGDVIAGDAVLCTVWDPGTAKERWS